MKTLILSQNQIEETSSLLKAGKVVCFPTETVYGIGVICDNEESYNDLVRIKGRAPDKPISLMSASIDDALPYLDIDKQMIEFIGKFYPGEITFLLKSKPGTPYWIDLGTGVVGLRVPSSIYVRTLLKRVEKPCLVSSANISGQLTSTKFDETFNVFNEKVAAIVKGECVSNVASTIVDLTKKEPVLIRQGKLDFDIILKEWRQSNL